MLRLLSIRNFVVVETLDLELDAGFTVLTGETGAGKSILLDALDLLLGDRFELRQLRPGAERAELAAVFEVSAHPGVAEWLAEHDLASSDGPLLLRRTLDAQGRSRAWINGRPATLAQLKDIGEQLVDLHGQHAHAAALIEAAAAGEEGLTDGDDALSSRLRALIAKLDAHSAHDPALAEIVTLLEPASIGIDEAARALRGYRQKLDVDPAELSRIEERLSAIHDLARKHRVRPEALPALTAETETRLA